MNFSIGNKISFLNEKGGGIIVKILNKSTVLIQIEDGFEIPYSIKEIVLIETNPVEKKVKKEETKNILTPAAIEKKDKPIKKAIAKIEFEKEVDLHIEELIDNTTGMSNGEKLEIQLNHFRNELEKAILNKQTRKITFIHGVGTGRLKQEIYKILKMYDNLRYHDAPYRIYGFGATEVII